VKNVLLIYKIILLYLLTSYEEQIKGNETEQKNFLNFNWSDILQMIVIYYNMKLKNGLIIVQLLCYY